MTTSLKLALQLSPCLQGYDKVLLSLPSPQIMTKSQVNTGLHVLVVSSEYSDVLQSNGSLSGQTLSDLTSEHG